MNKFIRIALIVIAILILSGAGLLAGTMFARDRSYGFGGMMVNNGWNTWNDGPYGPGMMKGGGGMMGGYGTDRGDVAPLTLDEAKTAAETYLGMLKYSDLVISEIMVFDNNAYVVVTEKSTGLGAFELLVDPFSRAAYPEYGPNMMWNLKYGGLNHQYMMGGGNGMMRRGMMGGYGRFRSLPADVSQVMTVTPVEAIKVAQAYLDSHLSGATAATDPIQFYGYYTLDFEREGVVVGMLSVNGFSGQVFLHTWHGAFVEEQAY